MKPKNCFLAVVAIFAVCWTSSGQMPSPRLDEGVNKHKENRSDFTRAYETLDVGLVAGFCTADAEYLSPKQDSVTGRDQIRSNFEEFFRNMKLSGRLSG